jgi:bifunctional DNA-binding transcriptional regulator/antitoxin component of YhaV-PrlF toxin-antitoxin module
MSLETSASGIRRSLGLGKARVTKNMTATVQPDGALVLPREACERLGLKAGQVLEVQTEGDLLVAWKKSATNPFENWRGRGRLPAGTSGDDYLQLLRDGHSG